MRIKIVRQDGLERAAMDSQRALTVGDHKAEAGFLYLIVDDDLLAGPREHSERIAEVLGSKARNIVYRLKRPGPRLMRVSQVDEKMRSAEEALVAAGYHAFVVTKSELFARVRMRRMAALRVGGSELVCLDKDGCQIWTIRAASELLLVVGSLRGNKDRMIRLMMPGSVRGVGDPLREAARNSPIVRLFTRGSDESVIVFGDRFNYRSLGDSAGLSGTENFLHLIDMIRQIARSARVDISYGDLDLPPLRVPKWSGRLELDDASQAFERHALFAAELWTRECLPVQSIRQPNPTSSQGSHVQLTQPPMPRSKLGAVIKDLSGFSRMRGAYRRLRGWGPLWLTLPLAAGAFLSLAYWYIGVRSVAATVSGGVAAGVASFCAAGLGIVIGFTSWRRYRLIEDVPTSKIRSLAVGSVEVIGVAEWGTPLRAPYSQTDCVYYRAWKERRSATRAFDRTPTRIDYSESRASFYVKDATGRILIRPEGALFEVDTKQVFSDLLAVRGLPRTPSLARSEVRFVEELIPVGMRVYVLGTAQLLSKTIVGHRQEVAFHLKEIKRDPLRRKAFDTDGDGHIDVDEWQQAVATVHDELLRTKLDSSGNEEAESLYIGERSSDVFIIADKDPKRYIRKLQWTVAVSALSTVIAFALSFWLLAQR